MQFDRYNRQSNLPVLPYKNRYEYLLEKIEEIDHCENLKKRTNDKMDTEEEKIVKKPRFFESTFEVQEEELDSEEVLDSEEDLDSEAEEDLEDQDEKYDPMDIDEPFENNLDESDFDEREFDEYDERDYDERDYDDLGYEDECYECFDI